MEFSLSWLADYLALGEGLHYEADDAGRHRLLRFTDEERRNASQIGERLTSIGFAVEGFPIAVLGTDQEPKLEVEVTPNRPDSMCHFGLARELAVALARPLRRPDVPFYGSSSTDGTGGTVVLEDREGCPRFVARVIRGVEVGPSPEWLARRLAAIGLRSINNVVDATNFVLWELGQPLHAYDLATVPGGELRVRRARAGEKLTTLDGKVRELDPEVLVIADRERAIGLAGILGGLDTEVSGRTSDVLLESAHFDRRRIRNGSRRLGLHTDASHRFERGVDFGACDEASRRCAALIVELGGGAVEEPAIDAVASRPETVAWRLAAADLARFLGFEVDGATIERALGGLGFEPRRVGDSAWEGTIPSWRAVDFEPRRRRPGVTVPAGALPEAYPQDIIEEVLRHVGFENVPSTLPRLSGIDAGAEPGYALRARGRRAWAALGYAEAIHFAFQDRAADQRFPVLVAAGPPLALANPLSERYTVLRRSLVGNLVAAAESNARRGAPGVRLFESGRLFPGGAAAEIEAFAAVAGGEPGGRWDRPRPIDLLAIKGDFEALFEELGIGRLTVQPTELPGVLAGTGAVWRAPAGLTVGWFGQIERVDASFDLYAGEVLVDRLPTVAERAVTAPSRFPGIVADLTLTHRDDLTWVELDAAIRGIEVEHLESFRLEDRYRGAGIPAGTVATTIRFEYNAGERSLTQEEINARQAALAAELERRFGVAREDTR